jgi:Domain of unknown function (DUF5666)
MTTKQLVQSQYFKIIALTLTVFLVALISFFAGVQVGFHKASFSARFGENYERNFLKESNLRGERDLSPLKKMAGKMNMDHGMRNAHGVGGTIVSVSGDSLVLTDKKNQENTVRITDATIINRGKNTVTKETLIPGERVIVVGKPQEDGVVSAHLIRVFEAEPNK